MVGTLADASGTALRARTDALQRAAFADHDGLDIDIAVVELLALLRILGLPVGDGAAEKLLETDGSLPLGELQQVESAVDLDASDGVGHQAHFTGGSGDVIQLGNSCNLLGLLEAFCHKSFTLSHSDYFLLLPE